MKKKLLIMFFAVNILFTSCLFNVLGEGKVVPLWEEDAIELHSYNSIGMKG
ncbi:hypothetical protein [Thermoanaerobacter pentosaceus]|uniref:Lipoprotein n=1 Tax=Thermoanaerobacter pentosaceus TaxID=694059 RepID=A0ABT9M219_9THEO|nr:hypothetical protein [Thermoanaerobacter pentosaceus]MDP9750178.1 hypothetical protein [Thermoanaerobacter pentosaceus]